MSVDPKESIDLERAGRGEAQRFIAAPMLWVVVVLSVIYLSLAGPRLRGASANNHFAHLAQSWLNGQLHLIGEPPHGNDWASYELITLAGEGPSSGRQIRGVRRGAELVTLSGERHKLKGLKVETRARRYYVSFPPLPGLVMLPFVWLWGLAASDVWVTLLFATLNGALSLALLRDMRQRGWLAEQPPHAELWLVALLCLGSAHLWCAVMGQVWYTALIMGVSFHLLYLRSALDTTRPLKAGLWLAAAFSTRPSLLILSLLFYGQLLPVSSPSLSWGERLRRGALFSLPPLLIGALLLWHNHARFGSPLEFGHSYLAGGQLQRIADFGLFHWVFLKKNLIAAFALLPLVHAQAPYLSLSMHGMALQLSSPGLLWSLFSLKAPATQPHDARVLRRLAGLSTTLILSALLLYQNTGWVQFSWRFVLDLLPSLLLLIGLSGARLGAWFKLSVLWGVAVNLLGALSFGRSGAWYEYLNLPHLLPH